MSIKTRETLIHTINVRGQFCNRLHSRKIWEALFNHTKARNFTKFDNFLVDLDEFAKQLADNEDAEIISFYWVHWGDGDYTKVFPVSERYMLIDTYEECYMIEFSQDQQLIKIIRVKVLNDEDI